MGSGASKQISNAEEDDSPQGYISTPQPQQQQQQASISPVNSQYQPQQQQQQQQEPLQQSTAFNNQSSGYSGYNNNNNNQFQQFQPQQQQQGMLYNSGNNNNNNNNNNFSNFSAGSAATSNNENLNASYVGMNSAPSDSASQPIGSVANNNSMINSLAMAELTIAQLQEKYGKQYEVVAKKILDDMVKNKSPHLTPDSKKIAQLQKLANLALNKELLMARFFSPDALRKFDYRDNRPEKSMLKVFFIVSDLESWRHIPLFARYLITPFEPKCGYVHTALQIGPWILHWFDNSMVYIDSANSTKCLLSLSADSIHMKDTEKFNAIIDRIVHWNTTVSYSEYSNNCQNFTFDLLKALGCQDDFKGVIGQHFKSLKSGGVVNCRYTNPFTKETVEFKTHAQLDQYVIKVLTEYATIKNLASKTMQEKAQVVAAFANDPEFREDYALLKAFDRGFWLKYNKFSSMYGTYKTRADNFENQRKNFALAQNMPLAPMGTQEEKYRTQQGEMASKMVGCACYTEQGLTFCPFGDPAMTMSIPQAVDVDMV